MRKQITLYDDMYQFYKDTKSKRLLIAFVEYLFEWTEPTELKWIEKTIFNSLKIRMENQGKKSYAGTKSHGGWRPPKNKSELDSNPSSELDHKNNRKTTEQTTEQATVQTTEKQEDNNTNVLLLSRLLSKDNNVDKKSTTKNVNEILYESYPFKDKWIDKQVCDKLIDKQLKQWSTLNWMLKEMKLEQIEMRIKQWTSHQYWKKLENRLRQYVEWMADSEDRLRALLIAHRKRLEIWPPYRKNPWDELCDLFWADAVKRLFMETKQWVKLFTT